MAALRRLVPRVVKGPSGATTQARSRIHAIAQPANLGDFGLDPKRSEAGLQVYAHLVIVDIAPMAGFHA